MTEEQFLAVELNRVERCLPDDPGTRRYYAEFFDALDWFRRRLPGQLSILIIPDEFQVNDQLYAQLRARHPDSAKLERDYPQRRILDYCREHALPCLDLLPPLRVAQAEARVYHLRDTHWNARGNRVAGEALAAFLLESPPEPVPSRVSVRGPGGALGSHASGKRNRSHALGG